MISKQPYKNKVVFPENISKVVEIQTEPIKKTNSENTYICQQTSS